MNECLVRRAWLCELLRTVEHLKEAAIAQYHAAFGIGDAHPVGYAGQGCLKVCRACRQIRFPPLEFREVPYQDEVAVNLSICPTYWTVEGVDMIPTSHRIFRRRLPMDD